MKYILDNIGDIILKLLNICCPQIVCGAASVIWFYAPGFQRRLSVVTYMFYVSFKPISFRMSIWNFS